MRRRVEAPDSTEEELNESEMMLKKAHECPVPKPKGIIGRLLGFEDKDQKN